MNWYSTVNEVKHGKTKINMVIVDEKGKGKTNFWIFFHPVRKDWKWESMTKTINEIRV